MHNLHEKDLQTLLMLYNQEIDTFKGRLLNGESWENLKTNRSNITELAIAIHKKGVILPNKIPGNPAEFPKTERSSDQLKTEM